VNVIEKPNGERELLSKVFIFSGLMEDEEHSQRHRALQGGRSGN